MVNLAGGLKKFLTRELTPSRYVRLEKRAIADRVKDESELKAEMEKYETLYRDSLKKSARNITIAVLVLFPLTLLSAYIMQKLINPSFGLDVSLEFYSVVAQLLAVLLIALYLTGNALLDPSYSDNLKSLIEESVWLRLLSADRLPSLYLFAVGQIACLTAIARGYSGTFLFLASLISISMLSGLVFLKILRSK